MITSTSVADFEARMKHWMSTEIAAITPLAQKLVGEIEQDGEIAFEELAEIAGKAVLKHASAVISGTEKFDAAVSDVELEVAAQGEAVARQTAQTAVQKAFEDIRAVAAVTLPATAKGAQS